MTGPKLGISLRSKSRDASDFLKRFDSVEFGLGNLHVVDYSLFWGSIRKNVKLRLNEYLKTAN